MGAEEVARVVVVEGMLGVDYLAFFPLTAKTASNDFFSLLAVVSTVISVIVVVSVGWHSVTCHSLL